MRMKKSSLDGISGFPELLNPERQNQPEFAFSLAVEALACHERWTKFFAAAA
jgi:hypothetical protein